MLTIQRVEGGFPHSEILGSKLVRSSPRHIAAYHVLHRLSAPRHPPDALTTLDYSHDRCPLGRAGHDHQRKTCLRISPKTCFCLPSISGANGCGPSLVRGTRLPARRICCLFTISNIRAHPQGGDRESHDKIHRHDTVMHDGHRIQDQRNGGACRDRTDDLKLAKLPLSQLS